MLTKQQAERDAAIARLEQSRIALASRLAGHHDNKHKVIEEAWAILGQVQNHIKVIPPKNGYMSAESYDVGKRSHINVKVIVSAFMFAKKSLKVDHPDGVLANAALVALNMSALLHLHQVAGTPTGTVTCQISNKDTRLINSNLNKNVTKVHVPEVGSSNSLDVLLGRG